MEHFCTCGAQLKLRVKNARIDQGTPRNSIFSLFDDTITLDVYICPNCSRVEFYCAQPPQPAAQPEQVTCPHCGTAHDPAINCPRCALDQVRGASPAKKAPPLPREEDPAPRLFRPRRDKNLPWEK